MVCLRVTKGGLTDDLGFLAVFTAHLEMNVYTSISHSKRPEGIGLNQTHCLTPRAFGNAGSCTFDYLWCHAEMRTQGGRGEDLPYFAILPAWFACIPPANFRATKRRSVLRLVSNVLGQMPHYQFFWQASIPPPSLSMLGLSDILIFDNHWVF